MTYAQVQDQEKAFLVLEQALVVNAIAGCKAQHYILLGNFA